MTIPIDRKAYYLRKHVESVFGSGPFKIFDDRDFALRCLNASDSRERLVALRVLSLHWKLDPELMISICTKIAFADKDERVVDYSIGLLGELQSGTFSSQSSRDLAQFALDCSKAAANRCKAYAALMRIRSEVCSFRPNNDDVEDFVAERKQKIADARKRRAALKDPPSFDHFDWELLQELAAG